MEILANDLKKQDILLQNGNKFFVLSILHANPKKQNKFMEVTAKNMLTLSQEKFTFLRDDIIEIEKSQSSSLKFLHEKNNLLYFLDPKTFEEYIVEKQKTEIRCFLVKDSLVKAFLNHKTIYHIFPPKFVRMQVVDIIFIHNVPYAITQTNLKVKLEKEIKIGEFITVDTSKSVQFA